MPDFSVIPWDTQEIIDYVCLLAATVMVTAFPVGYALIANLRDRLAQVVLLSTSLTSLAFITAAILWPMEHAGYQLDENWAHYVRRALYLSVGLGKVLLLVTAIHEWRVANRPEQDGQDERDTASV